MARPIKDRHVWHDVEFDYFKPKGVRLSVLEEVNLNVEELEAIRLNDLLEMEQWSASEKMQVSQPTYSRILKEARKKLAYALVNGQAIRIKGGTYKMPNKDGTGPLGKGPKTGRGRGSCAGMTSDMLSSVRRGGGPYGKGRRFQNQKQDDTPQAKEENTSN